MRSQPSSAAAAAVVDDAPLSDVREYREVPLTHLRLSPLNPRKYFDPARLAELAASMGGGVGIIEPLVVRSFSTVGLSPDQAADTAYEIVAGARRFKAAQLAGLATVPVSIRSLTDAQVLELMVIENDQRQDITPLEEADGFKRLISTFGVDIDKLAARIGRSRKYIYDRVKLLDLIAPAQQLLQAGRITAGHAILLARLPKDQQKRTIDVDGNVAPLFEPDASLLAAADAEAEDKAARKDPYVGMKVKSVRELEAWIQTHCRFAPPADVQRELYPETAAKLEVAKKVVHIHLGHYVQPDARDEDPQRIFGSQSWRRADGLEESKPCGKSKLGLVVVGEGQGKAFDVCVNRDCPVHFAKEQRAKARNAKLAPEALSKKRAAEDARQQRERAARDAREKAFTAAKPAILAAVADKVRSLAIGKVITHVLASVWNVKAAQALMPRADASAEGALRLMLLAELEDECGPYRAEAFAKEIKQLLGLDVAPILKQHAPSPVAEKVQTPAKAKTQAKPAKKKAAKKR